MLKFWKISHLHESESSLKNDVCEKRIIWEVLWIILEFQIYWHQVLTHDLWMKTINESRNYMLMILSRLHLKLSLNQNHNFIKIFSALPQINYIHIIILINELINLLLFWLKVWIQMLFLWYLNNAERGGAHIYRLNTKNKIVTPDITHGVH